MSDAIAAHCPVAADRPAAEAGDPEQGEEETDDAHRDPDPGNDEQEDDPDDDERDADSDHEVEVPGARQRET